jgi:hypothetical protein
MNFLEVLENTVNGMVQIYQPRSRLGDDDCHNKGSYYLTLVYDYLLCFVFLTYYVSMY